MSDAALEALVRRDRIVVGAALAVLVVAASLYLRHLASAMVGMAMPDMPSMPGMVMTMHPWNWVEIGTLVVMWAVMMVAMMMPAAAPMILMFATIYRRRAAAGRTAVPTAIFVLAYLVVWAIFSVVAAVAQAGLHAAALSSLPLSAGRPRRVCRTWVSVEGARLAVDYVEVMGAWPQLATLWYADVYESRRE
jgi:predicted metal-binding membrane protein